MRLALSFVLVAGCGLGLTMTKATDEGPDSREVGGDSAGAVETCDGEDNDGDGEIDEGYDVDGDGFTSCGSAEADPDCDDADAAVNPGATETAGNEVDDDCDGVVDSGTWRSGDLLITEVLYAPVAVTDLGGEWIEIYNASSRTVDAGGLVFTSADGSTFTVANTAPLPIAPGASFVLGTNGEEATNGDVPVDYVYRGLLLDNTSDEIVLSAGDTVLDDLAWDDGATMPRAVGATLMVDPGSYGESNPRFWCAATSPWGNGTDKGSPGAINEPCATIDHDGDGYTAAAGDCDDTNGDVHPGAASPDGSVDWDCDGVRNGDPTAVATSTGGAYACDPIQLDGSGSSDPDGDRLTYAWSLVSAPAASAATTASIDTATSARPTLYADVVGTYIFSLTVSDGHTTSAPAHLTVDVGTRPSNGPPTANAGPNQTSSASANCTPISYGSGGYDCNDCAAAAFSLSAAGSSDADGDTMSYAWAITSGAIHGTLSTTRGSTTTLTVSGVTATYGSANVADVVVTLTATDCMGATGTDDVTIEMQCSGY